MHIVEHTMRIRFKNVSKLNVFEIAGKLARIHRIVIEILIVNAYDSTFYPSRPFFRAIITIPVYCRGLTARSSR